MFFPFQKGRTCCSPLSTIILIITVDLFPESPIHLLLQADIAGIADNEMVKHVDVEQFASFDQLLRYIHIFWRRGVTIDTTRSGYKLLDRRKSYLNTVEHILVVGFFIAY